MPPLYHELSNNYKYEYLLLGNDNHIFKDQINRIIGERIFQKRTLGSCALKFMESSQQKLEEI